MLDDIVDRTRSLFDAEKAGLWLLDDSEQPFHPAAARGLGPEFQAQVRELKLEPGLDIYLAGGAALAGVLVDEIDDLVIKLYPVLAGSGVPFLSAAAFAPRALRRVGSTSFDSGHVLVEYRRV